MKLGVARGPDWVPTVISGLGKTKYLQMTNIGDHEVIMPTHAIIGLWTEGGMVPRTQGFVTVGSGRYKEWQTLAYEATTDRMKELPKEQIGPLVDRPTYATPKCIMKRPFDALDSIHPAISMVTQQDDNLQHAGIVVAKEGTVNEVGANLPDETNLSSGDNERETEMEIAMRGDYGTEREEQDDRLPSSDVHVADNRAGLDRCEATH